MSEPTALQLAGTLILVGALAHAFSSPAFQHLAERHPRHGGLFRLLGETEVVFGFWAFVLVGTILALHGSAEALVYAESRDFTEPLFVFAIMIVAGSRPVSALAARVVDVACRGLPLARPLAVYFAALSLLPLLGSLITEPGAMTLAATLLRDRVFRPGGPQRLAYATLAVLFVNVSVGGVLTVWAAPPVLMVASRWGWDTAYMLRHFGTPAVLTVLVNAVGATLLFRHDILAAGTPAVSGTAPPVPGFAMAVSAALLAGIVASSHHPVIFVGLLLLFIGYSAAYPRHHEPLIAREALLVASFLAGLVVLGGLQRWWLEPVLKAMDATGIYYAAAGLTALTDNAALTYLGSTVPGLDEAFKRALVAGALTGGGLTVIANAPNPAGAAILRHGFARSSISAWRLLVAALVPTLVAVAAFRGIG